MELPFFRECRAKVGKRFLPELSIKRLNDLQQPEACLTFPLLFHPAEMKNRYFVYELHLATQNEGMEVTGMEREEGGVFHGHALFAPMESSMATARPPTARIPPKKTKCS